MEAKFHLLPTFLFLALSGAESPLPSVREIASAGYQLAWGDEFDGDKVDDTKWLYRQDHGWGSAQTPANCVLKDGQLHLLLRKEKSAGKEYTGGGLITKREFAYGYYEARFKCPATAGWHTSFWLSSYDETKPGHVGGLGLHEMDICEQDSWQHDHYTRTLWIRYPKDAAGKRPKIEGWKHVETPDLSKDFHVWGCEFTPEHVRYFFEGKLVQDWDVSGYRTGNVRIWLSCIAANIGHKTGDPVDAELPASAVYDYVRFFGKR